MASILKRGRRWRALIRKRGETRCQTFDTKGAARTWATRIEAEIDRAYSGGHRALNGATVADLLDRYVREVKPIKPWGRSKDKTLEVIRREIGDKPARNINVSTLLDFAEKRRQAGAGPETVGQYLTYTGRVLSVARNLWRFDVDANAAQEARRALSEIGAIRPGRQRNRRPTADELEQLYSYWRGRNDLALPMEDIARFAITSAMRLGEITGLRWDDLNGADRTILVRNRKHPTEKLGNDQTGPLLGEAWQIALRQPRLSDRIFPYSCQRVSDCWRRSTQARQIRDLRFHDLRHEGTSRLFEAGYAIQQVALVTGHRDWASLKRYTQIRAKDLHRD